MSLLTLVFISVFSIVFRKRRRRRARQSTKSTGHKGLVARGVRVLYSVAPGSKLQQKFYDFGFKNIGFINNTGLPINATEISASMYVTGLGALFHLRLQDILFGGVTHGVRVPNQWRTNYLGGILKSITIHIECVTPMSSRQGVWALCFIPFRSSSEESYYVKKGHIIPFESLKLIPGARSSPTTSSLTVTFRPSKRDGRLFYGVGLDDGIGAVGISFSQYCRTVYTNFSASEFGCITTVTGVVKLQRPQEVGKAVVYGREIDDRLKTCLAFAESFDRTLQMSINQKSDTHSVIEDPECVVVTGAVTLVKPDTFAGSTALKLVGGYQKQTTQRAF